MRRMLAGAARFVRNPAISMIAALFMVGAALLELVEEAGDLGAEHGVVVFGVAHIVATLGDLVKERLPEIADEVAR